MASSSRILFVGWQHTCDAFALCHVFVRLHFCALLLRGVNYKSLLQNIVSFIGLFCTRDL